MMCQVSKAAIIGFRIILSALMEMPGLRYLFQASGNPVCLVDRMGGKKKAEQNHKAFFETGGSI